MRHRRAKKRHKQHGVAQVEICGCRINLE